MPLIEPPFVISMVSLMAFPLPVKRLIVFTNYSMLLVWLLHKFACLGIHNCGWSIPHPPSHKLIDFQPILISGVRKLSPNFNGLKCWLWLLEHTAHVATYIIPLQLSIQLKSWKCTILHHIIWRKNQFHYYGFSPLILSLLLYYFTNAYGMLKKEISPLSTLFLSYPISPIDSWYP